MKNCPNCGARVLYNICDYCGTLLKEEEKPRMINKREVRGSNNDWLFYVYRDEKGNLHKDTFFKGHLISKT